MEYKIIDNALDKDLINYLNNIFIYKIPHFYGHSSNENSLKFYTSDLNKEDIFINYIVNALNIKNNILRSYINVQFNGMEGDWHIDDGTETILLMISKTLMKNSGEFKLKKENNIINIDFIQNRLIIFNSKILHKGCAPIEINTPRVTLIFKTEK